MPRSATVCTCSTMRASSSPWSTRSPHMAGSTSTTSSTSMRRVFSGALGKCSPVTNVVMSWQPDRPRTAARPRVASARQGTGVACIGWAPGFGSGRGGAGRDAHRLYGSAMSSPHPCARADDGSVGSEAELAVQPARSAVVPVRLGHGGDDHRVDRAEAGDVLLAEVERPRVAVERGALVVVEALALAHLAPRLAGAEPQRLLALVHHQVEEIE